MASKINKGEILAKFFDDGEYTALFADGAVSAACGYAAGQQAYAVYQNGEAVTVKDVEKNIKVLEMAAQTGCPVVTFYNSVGAKLAEGLDVLTASAKLNAQIAKVSGVVDRISKTMQNELCNIVTIFLGVSVGATATADSFFGNSNFLTSPIGVLILGLCAFSFATAGGVLFGKLMCLVTRGKINPLIGSAGVSAVPMAARVSQVVGQKENPGNFLLMHAMGPNVAGVIGSAVAAGVFLTLFK